MARFRFSGFEADTSIRELRRNGYRIPIQPQPFQVLCLLLEAAGEVVSRERLRVEIWQGDHLADADQSLNIAVRKLRDALNDSPVEPTFIQTIPRVGYRFLAETQVIETRPSSSTALKDSCTTEAAPVPTLIPGGETPVRVVGMRPSTARRAMVALLLVAAAAAGYFLWQQRAGKPAQPYTVMLSRFEDATGEPDLEGAYESYLEAILAPSQVVRVASRERVGDTLKLMRKPTVARPGLPDAVEVCRRDPGIRAVVGGELRKVGNEYVLSVRLLNPVSGDVMIAKTGEATDRANLVGVLRQFAESVRLRIGDDLPPPGDSLDKATTQSLLALKCFTDGHALGRRGDWRAAEVFLREAIRLDPEFASAHIFLAWAVLNQNMNAVAEFNQHASRAMELADSASESEALFIRGSYHHLRQEPTKAIPFYEALWHRYPDHPWVTNNLTVLYRQTNQRAKWQGVVRQLPLVRPNNPSSYSENVLFCFCALEYDPNCIGKYNNKFVELVREAGTESETSLALARAAINRALDAWVRMDVRRAKEELDQAEKLVAGVLDQPGAIYTATTLALGQLALGRLRASATTLASSDIEASIRYRWEMWSPLNTGDKAYAARLVALQTGIRPHPLNVLAMLKAGAPSEASEMFSRLDKRAWATSLECISVVEGEIAYGQGRMRDSSTILESALETIPVEFAERFLGTLTLARALDAQGRTDDAIAQLELVTRGPRACGGFSQAAFWPHLRFDLMELYRKRNRLREAEAIRTELKTLLAFADENHMLRKAVN